jgi:hypothetical protein
MINFNKIIFKYIEPSEKKVFGVDYTHIGSVRPETSNNNALKFALAVMSKSSKKPKHMPQLTEPELRKTNIRAM